MSRPRRPPPPPRSGCRDRWTIQRATGAGIGAAGWRRLLVSVAFGSWADALLYPYAALLALHRCCAASRSCGSPSWTCERAARGAPVRPIRMFDVAAGLVIAAPSAYALWRVWPILGL